MYNGPTIPATIPNISVSFPNAIPADLNDTLKTIGYTEANVKGSKVLIFREPTKVLIDILLKTSASKTASAPDETINLSCLPVLQMVKRIFSAFLTMHVYPAFKDPEHENSVGRWEISDVNSDKRGAPDDSTQGRKRARTDPEGGEDEEMEEIEEEQTEREPAPRGNTIKVALPVQTDEVGWGDETQIPNTYGSFVQYIPDLANYDSKTVISVILRYFLGCLGSTAGEVNIAFERIRAAMGILSKTTVGKELAHLAKCIDISLQCQARCFPIYSEGAYTGCVISGYGYTIRMAGKDYTAQAQDIIQGYVTQSFPHKSTVAAILNVVGEQAIDENGHPMEFLTIMDLRDKVLEKWTLTESERDEIVKLARHLVFPNKHWPLSPTHIIDALHLIATEDMKLPDSLPLHPSKLLEKDKIAAIWSGFGALAPTCHFEGGPLVSLEVPKDSSGKISWKQVPLTDAIASIQKILRDKSFGKASGNRRSGAYKDRMFEGNVAKDIWSALRLASKANIATGKASRDAAVVGEGSDLFASYY